MATIKKKLKATVVKQAMENKKHHAGPAMSSQKAAPKKLSKKALKARQKAKSPTRRKGGPDMKEIKSHKAALDSAIPSALHTEVSD